MKLTVGILFRGVLPIQLRLSVSASVPARAQVLYPDQIKSIQAFPSSVQPCPDKRQ
jgi:hypothetical protein